MKRKLIVAAISAAFLTACGGGGGSDSPKEPSSPVADVATASKETVAAAGLTKISTTSADEVAYDVAASIGDTWRIVLNTANKTFTVKVLETQYSLADRTGPYTVSTSGNVTTYTGERFTLSVDNRTQLVTGSIGMGSEEATVSGSGYAATDLSKLAGTYLFVSATRNLISQDNYNSLAGGFKVNANGTIDMCVGGVFNSAGNCSKIAGLPDPETRTLTMDKDGNGLIKLKEGEHDFGIAHVHAGDRGVALIIDRFGLNDENVMRVGTFFAAKQAKLSNLDGNYYCSDIGGGTGTVAISGATATITNLYSKETHKEVVSLNKISNGTVLADLDGLATFQVSGESVAESANILPLSSSMFVAATQDSTELMICAAQ